MSKVQFKTIPGVSTVRLLGVPFANLTNQGCVELVVSELKSGRGGWMVTPNVDILRRIVKDPAAARLVGEANLFVADGMPLIWASRLQGTPLPERVAGSDLLVSLSRGAAGAGRSVYLLGGNPGMAKGAAGVLTGRLPGLRVAGFSEIPMGWNVQADVETRERIADQLRKAAPDIVYVALGFPKQEQVIDALREVLPGAWWLGVGVSFSFICGEVHRAPRWMQVTGLEWTHRLAQEPGRLGRRYLIDGPPFAFSLLLNSLLSCGKRKDGKKEGAPR